MKILNLLWKIPVILAVLIILYSTISYMALDYVADRECIKYGGRGYVVFPRYFCTKIMDGDEMYLLPEVLRNANPGQPDPMSKDA